MGSLVYSESISSDISESEFIRKKWVYASDSNGQSYQSQVIIDTTTISNSGAYPNWGEGFIAMPLVVTLSSQNAASLPAGTNIADYSWGFKNGFWHMTNSMSVQYNNGTIIQETPFSNVFASFKALTEWGWMDVQNDNAASWSFAPTYTNANNLSASGVGLFM
jgi:hypothetical protein